MTIQKISIPTLPTVQDTEKQRLTERKEKKKNKWLKIMAGYFTKDVNLQETSTCRCCTRLVCMGAWFSW